MDELITREKLQNIALQFMKSYKYLALLWATRVGKTPAAIRIAKEYPGRWNIVVAETIHINQWKDEFKKFDAEYLLKDVNIFCYHSLHKYREENINWIFDEAHHLLSDKRWELITNIQLFNKVVFLTATLTDFEVTKIKTKFKPLAQDIFSLSDAIKNKILPIPKIYKVGITLEDNKLKRHEIVVIEKGNKYTKSKQTVIFTTPSEWYQQYIQSSNIKLIINCTQKEKYDLLDRRYRQLKGEHASIGTKWSQLKYLRAGLDRKTYLASIKTDTVKILTNMLKDKSVLIYANTIAQAIGLGSRYRTMHSKNTFAQNKKILNNFYEKNINHLYVVGMLVEGVNLYNVDTGIIVQLDSKQRTFTQKSGRLLLSAFPTQYILYIKGTKDEEYLKNALSNVNSNYIYDIDANVELKKLNK